MSASSRYSHTEKGRATQRRHRGTDKGKATYRRYNGTDTARATGLRYRFGITLDEYNALLEAQEGVCAICGQPEIALGRNGRTRHLSVDHDHRTGQVRGLLCHECNVELGRFEREERLKDWRRAAKAYLARVSCPSL